MSRSVWSRCWRKTRSTPARSCSFSRRRPPRPCRPACPPAPRSTIGSSSRPLSSSGRRARSSTSRGSRPTTQAVISEKVIGSRPACSQASTIRARRSRHSSGVAKRCCTRRPTARRVARHAGRRPRPGSAADAAAGAASARRGSARAGSGGPRTRTPPPSTAGARSRAAPRESPSARRVGEREAVRLVLAGVPARAEPELDAPARDVVGRRDHPREHGRPAEGRRGDHRPEADALGHRRQSRERRPGIERPASRDRRRPTGSGRSGTALRGRSPRRRGRARPTAPRRRPPGPRSSGRPSWPWIVGSRGLLRGLTLLPRIVKGSDPFVPLDEEGDRLDVRRVREHVHRADALEPVAPLGGELLHVAGERRRVAGDVDDLRRLEPRRAGAAPSRRGPRAAGRRRPRRACRRARRAPRASGRPRRRRRPRWRSRSARRSRSRRRPTPRRPRRPRPSALARGHASPIVPMPQ